MASAKTTPGSVNVKVGKGSRVLLLHSCLQNMNEQAFLQVVPDPKLVRKTASQLVCPAPPKRNPADAQVGAFVEANPDMDVAMAQEQLRGKFSAVRPNQTYYKQLTILKAHQHTRPKLQNYIMIIICGSHFQPLQKLDVIFFPIPSMYGKIWPYIGLIFMVNVGKYTIHGCYGLCKTSKFVFIPVHNEVKLPLETPA